MPTITLAPAREKSVLQKHRWIFSGAIASVDAEDGAIAKVVSSTGRPLGHAYYTSRSDISARMIAWAGEDPHDALRASIERAVNLRKVLFDHRHTTAYRLIHGESDGLPGLVADLYDDILVLQISTLGMERLKPFILEQLTQLLSPRAILERSDMPSRYDEGLDPLRTHLAGEDVREVTIRENSMPFVVDFSGQKTGFFLDQREMRSLVRRLSKGRSVANVFGYSGAFSVAALTGGAKRADTIDISQSALDLAERNLALSEFSSSTNRLICEDAFDFLRNNPLTAYDFIILDPPAFAKKSVDKQKALTWYREINAQALRKAKSGSFLLTCSCSHFISVEDFRTMVYHSARDARRTVRIIQEHRLAMDHASDIVHREGEYLKSLMLWVE